MVQEFEHPYSEQQGIMAETRAADIIGGLHTVERVSIAKPFSFQDAILKSDFTVFFRKGQPLDKADVQVKSSEAAIRAFLEDLDIMISQNRLLRGIMNHQDWLIAHRLIVINGFLAQERIVTSFDAQLTQIIEAQRRES